MSNITATTETPLESRLRWRLHREASEPMRAAGGHFTCATEIGFLAVEAVTGERGEFQARPCARCLGIWEAHKQQQKGKAA
jgi:hypothetical protein